MGTYDELNVKATDIQDGDLIYIGANEYMVAGQPMSTDPGEQSNLTKLYVVENHIMDPTVTVNTHKYYIVINSNLTFRIYRRHHESTETDTRTGSEHTTNG